MEKFHSCVGCSKRFKVVSKLDRLTKQHEVEMNVECPFCSKINAIVWPQDDGLPHVLTEDGKSSHHLGGIKKEILSSAKQLVAERLGVIAASRKLAGLRHYVEPQIAEVLLTFVGIDSETDSLPIGVQRNLWDREALQRKDREIADAEQFYRDRAIKAATELIRRLEMNQFYHGTRAELKPGDLIAPANPPNVAECDGTITYVYLTSNLDAAIWEAELAAGEGPGRVYIVEPIGQIEDASNLPNQKSPGHPWMSSCSREPLRVTGEVTEWTLYHGTRAQLTPGDLIQPGHTANFGNKDRTTTYVYFTRTLDAATWGAELAAGEGPGRIYIVEPTGPFEEDPNLTNKKFRGNPTKSFRSRQPLRIRGEITDWQGHSPEALKAMKDGVERSKRLGVEPMDD
jgi:hypothetical protein